MPRPSALLPPALLVALLGFPAAYLASPAGAQPAVAPAASATSLPVFTVRGERRDGRASVDAVVEAVRQTVVSAQVAGAIVTLSVKAGDTVRAGQPLARIDAQSATENLSSSLAQVNAAQAQLDVATREYERQKQLFARQFISQAALERAQSQWQVAQAQLDALNAQARAARAQSGFYVINAPYAGVVSDVPVVLGDMVTPGRPLVVMHDPAALRISAAVPQGLIGGIGDGKSVRYEIPGVSTTGFEPAGTVQLLPSVDPATHTAQLRLSLPVGTKGLVPGLFARVWIPATGDRAAERLMVPAVALVRQGEMTGLYVLDSENQPRLRQVRAGPRSGDAIEVLSGLAPGERVVTDPQVARRTMGKAVER